MQSKLITVAEAAQQKGVSRSAIYKAIKQGRLNAQQVLGKTALSHEEVARWQAGSTGWPKGRNVSVEAKAKISESQKRRWSARKRTHGSDADAGSSK